MKLVMISDQRLEKGSFCLLWRNYRPHLLKGRQPNSGEKGLKAASFINLDMLAKFTNENLKKMISAFEAMMKPTFFGKKFKWGVTWRLPELSFKRKVLKKC